MKRVDINELKMVVSARWSQLNDVNDEYLSDAGKAAKEAYAAVQWYICFYDDVNSLKEDEEFMDLINIPDKHSEYYKIIRLVNRVVEHSSEV